MFTISIETYFWAEHALTLPGGSSETLHGHNWQVRVDVSRLELGEMAIVMDFNKLKAIVNDIVAEISGQKMEKCSYFQQNGSSAEMVAKYIYEKLVDKLPKETKLKAVTVTEQPGCTAEFTAE